MDANSDRAILKVDLSRLKGNIEAIGRLVSPGVMIMAVVKANAYGHGILEIARAAVDAGAHWLGVATIQEGVSLRKNGIKHPILVMGSIFGDEYDEVLEHDLTATIFSRASAELLAVAAIKADKKANIHIKIDSGMNALGYKPEDVDKLCEKILDIEKMPNICVSGIYSHFVASESDNSFTFEQFLRFTSVLECLALKGLHVPIKHISNSGAVINNSRFNLDMVRVGILMYGMCPKSSPTCATELPEHDILPIMSFKSSVAHLKTIEQGESVGYARNFFAAEKMDVAVVPVGYGDGISRSLSNKGKVLVNGRFCDIVGNVCMDQMMVDVTGTNAKIGDEVVIIGKQGFNSISAENISLWQGSINYEIATSISKRVKRIFIK